MKTQVDLFFVRFLVEIEDTKNFEIILSLRTPLNSDQGLEAGVYMDLPDFVLFLSPTFFQIFQLQFESTTYRNQ